LKSKELEVVALGPGMAGAFGSAKRERPGLLGLGEILVATGLDQGLAKNGTNETGIAGCP
jgi:hypothetical protein